MGNLIPFDLEKFKAGQKAITRDGGVATFIGICDDCGNDEKIIVHSLRFKHVYGTQLNGLVHENGFEANGDLVSMVSRHQHLIDSYDPEDTWQVKINDKWGNLHVKPLWDEERDYRLHPHNDLIKAWKKGAKIEAYIVGDWVEEPNPDWYEDTQYRIKPEPEFTYPIYKQIADIGLVVKFRSLNQCSIVQTGSSVHEVGSYLGNLCPHTYPMWQDWTPPTKTEPTIHCLAYDAKRFNLEAPVVHARVVKKEVAEATGWKIIQEWEV